MEWNEAKQKRNGTRTSLHYTCFRSLYVSLHSSLGISLDWRKILTSKSTKLPYFSLENVGFGG